METRHLVSVNKDEYRWLFWHFADIENYVVKFVKPRAKKKISCS